jgi:hypothetical protein
MPRKVFHSKTRTLEIGQQTFALLESQHNPCFNCSWRNGVCEKIWKNKEACEATIGPNLYIRGEINPQISMHLE